LPTPWVGWQGCEPVSARFEELDWRPTRLGEISLRRRFEPTLQADTYEAKLGDEFLMSSAFTVAEVALAAPRNGIVEIAGPERAPFNEIVARYLKAVGDPRGVVRDPEARYWGGRVEERSLVPLGEARLGRIGLDEWLRRSQASA